MDDPNERTLMRQCVNGICHCDFRLTVTNCVESFALRTMYLSFIALSALVIIIGIGLSSDRYFRKGHRLFETGSDRGLLRPKPIDCLVFFITVFNSKFHRRHVLVSHLLLTFFLHYPLLVVRMICAILIVIDHDPTNVLARSFMFEFSWHFGYAACALYLLGIAQTLSESHKNLTRGWLPSPTTVDIIGICFMLGPVVLHNICSIAAGALAYSQLGTAEVFTNLLYGFWFMHCITLSLTVLFAGVRLIRILNCHLIKFPPTGDRYKSIRLGVFKIQALMTIIVLCLAGYAVFLLVYAIVRDQVTQNSAGSIAMATIWNFWAPVATLLGEIALIVDPKLGENTNFGIKTSSTGKTTTNNTSSNALHSMTMSMSQQQSKQQDQDGMMFVSATAAPTLSLGAFDPFTKDPNGPLTKPMFAAEVDHTGIPLEDSVYIQHHHVNNNNNNNNYSQNHTSIGTGADSDSDTFVMYPQRQDSDIPSRSSKSHLVHHDS
ncbi:uncharacterized protein BX664DRAFT_382779 [Halteromyces radiatus]|uniref:uncharacterized protein n=1 Tax=Halteromyces radiatus TaxID=101107 RepID=UPI0022210311|nr:uncharacterized protein BX664DRAFT_382779 [Halteromyces radiatus]KAI8096318.1 hypothetical protein BX664DRAFT_382779 [Halteromyces radiatus]